MEKSAHNLLVSSNASLRGFVAAVFRKKWLVAATLITAALASGLFAFLLPDKYESRMKILVRNMRTESQVTAGNEVAVDRNEVSEAQIVSEIELLKSRDLLEKLVRQVNLISPEDIDAGEKGVEKAVLKLEKDLQITPVKKANIIEVTYASNSPETAALVLTRLSELYLEKHLQVHHPPGAYDFFKNQASSYEQELRDSENKLSNFQQQKEVVSIQQQKDMLLAKLLDANSKLKDLNGTIAETDKRILELQNQLKSTERRVVTQSRELPNQFSTERLNTMLVELRNRRIQLLTKFQPTDRVVKEVDDQIRTTTEALEKARQSSATEQATDLNPLRQTLESDLTKAKVEQQGRLALRGNLDSQAKQYREQLTNLEKATTQHNDLARKVKQAEENYQLYAKKEEESRINDALDKQKISNVSIAESPAVPLTPNKSNRGIALILGLSLGVIISFGGAFVADLFRETFATPHELEKFTDYPVLATVALQASGAKGFNTLETTEETVFDQDLEDFLKRYETEELKGTVKPKTVYLRREVGL